MADNKSILNDIAGSLGQLTGAGGLGDLVSYFGHLIKQTDGLTKASTKLGVSFPAVTKALGPELGKLAGRNTELSNALELMDESLSINNQQLNKLSLETRVNGGNTKGLQRVLRQSITTGNLSNENIGSFSERIAKLRDTYQISTDNLVEAFAKTSSNLELAFFGVGQGFSEALMEFEGKFGKGSSDLFEKFSSQLLNPEFFGKSMMFGLQDEIARLTKSGATGAEVQSALLDSVKELQPRIQQMRDSLGNLPESKKLEMLGQYFGSKDVVLLAEAISKLQPKDIVPGGPAQDPFANLQVAIDKATTQLQELASKVVPFLVENMGLIVSALQYLGTVVLMKSVTGAMSTLSTNLRSSAVYMRALGKSFTGATKLLGGISKSFNVASKFIGSFARFLGPWGLLISLLLQFLPELMEFFGGSKDEEKDSEAKKAAQEERKRLAEERQKAMADAKAALDYKTNNYLQMQSNSLNKTMNGIIYGNDIQKRAVDLSEQQIAALNKLIAVVINNSNRGQTPIPQGVRTQ